MPAPDDRGLHPPGAARKPYGILLLLAVLLAAALAWWWWGRQAPLPPPSPPAEPTAEIPAATALPPAPSTGPQHPLEPPSAPAAALPALADSDPQVATALAELLGRGPVQSLLQTDGFVRRVVATVDNLPRASVPAQRWPAQPTPQRFLVQEQDGSATIAPANAARYGAWLSFAEAVPLQRAVALYARFYPLFQQAYEELGYPGRYFNDRLVAVLDHLLQTPEPAGPLAVQLLEIRGGVDPRPWVRYEFSDPALQELSGGQKILLRMGLANERRAKTVLAELRRLVATGVAPAASAAR